MKPKILNIRQGILEDNDRLAHSLRSKFNSHKVLVINVVSSPGSGKTELLSHLISKLIARGKKVCAVVGDLETDNDAKRIQASGAEAYQIKTHGNCHLDANLIKKSLKNINWQDADILFIENVGNLVCPASYDLGEGLRIVLMSVTEGEDKPLKYPTIFNSADICVISKTDLTAAVEFDEKTAIANITNISPDIKIIKTSAKKDEGLDELIDYLLNM